MSEVLIKTYITKVMHKRLRHYCIENDITISKLLNDYIEGLTR